MPVFHPALDSMDIEVTGLSYIGGGNLKIAQGTDQPSWSRLAPSAARVEKGQPTLALNDVSVSRAVPVT